MEPATPSQPTTSRPFWWITAPIGLGLSAAAPFTHLSAEAGIPDTAAWIGRFHPFVLHFPIVLLILALGFELARLPLFRRVLPRPDASTVTSVLGWGAVGCTIAVICGWLLGQSGGYEKELLDRHQWSGAATAVGANLTLIFRLCAGVSPAGLLNGLGNTVLLATCGIMTFAGHYGANLTHGETYLTDQAPNFVRKLIGLKPKKDPNSIEIKPAEQRLLWEDVAQPIFEERCNSCHNEGKAKGKLRLDSLAAILKGGETGPAIEVGKPKDSLILERVHMPLDEEEHMPPKGKPQMTEEEIAALTFWIEKGAPADRKAGDFEIPANIRAALDSLLSPAQRKALEAKVKAEAEALEKTLTGLRTSLPGRLATVAPGKPELEYSPGIKFADVTDLQLKSLTPVAASVVTLDLQQTKVTDAGLVALAPFTKLRKLQLQNTALTDAALVPIGKLASLEILNLYGCAVTDAGLQNLKTLKNLKKVYLWQSKVTEEGAKKLREALPGLEVNLGMSASAKVDEPAKPEMPAKPETPAAAPAAPAKPAAKKKA